MNAGMGGDFQCRRIDVVGALAQVDVLVRMQVLVLAALVAEQLQRAIGDDLVGIHVGGGAGAALNHVDDELVVQFSVADFLAGGDDGIGARLIEQSEFPIAQRRGLLHAGECVDQVGIDGDRRARNRKIFHRAQGVNAVIGFIRNVAVAEQVVLGSVP